MCPSNIHVAKCRTQGEEGLVGWDEGTQQRIATRTGFAPLLQFSQANLTPSRRTKDH